MSVELPKLWVLFSGGKDSTSVAHYLASQNKLDGCIFLDTGIGTPDIIPFVKSICEKRGWRLEIARTPRSYENMVERYGFPRHYSHNMYMTGLKLHALQVFKKKFGKVDLASGVRYAESKRRFQNVKEVSIIAGMKCYAPIADWTTKQVWNYIRENNLEISPAYQKLHISGDCLCGAFAQKEESMILKIFYPEVFERITKLEKTYEGTYRYICTKKKDRCFIITGIIKDRCERHNLPLLELGNTWGNHGGMKAVKDQSILCAECEI